MKDELKKVEKEIDDVQKSISVCNKDLAENRIQRQELRAKINELRSPTLLAELSAFEDKKRELRENIVKLEAETKNIGGQVETILIPEKENILKVMKQHDKEEENFRDETTQITDKIKTIENSLKEKERKQKDFYDRFKGLFTKRSKIDDEIKKKESKIDSLSEHERKAELKTNEFSLTLAKVKAEFAGLEEEFKQYEGVELDTSRSEQNLKSEITRLENTIENLGSINMKALEIYDSIRNEYTNLMEKKEKLKLEKEDVLVMMNEIELKKTELFMKTFDVVNDHFKTFFKMLSSKGEASLVLEDQNNPFEGGVLIKVRLTSKKFMDIRSLSGGEKTLTALAFIFSIQEHEPASFYVLDEVDAALDKKNSEKLAELIRKYAGNAQYLIISHNDAIIAEADNLYGVSMNEHGVSNVVSLKI
jgi:chromosome segregation protein